MTKLIVASPLSSSHLTAGEIVEQLVHASRVEPIKNVVFMGMVVYLLQYLAFIHVCSLIHFYLP